MCCVIDQMSSPWHPATGRHERVGPASAAAQLGAPSAFGTRGYVRPIDAQHLPGRRTPRRHRLNAARNGHHGTAPHPRR